MAAQHWSSPPSVAAADASQVVARYLREGDEQAALRLLQESFPYWPRVDMTADPLDHLRWKLQLDGPGPHAHKVAEADGQIVGLGLAIIRRAKLRDRDVRCFISMDACVHPAYRERGVMSAIRDLGRSEDLRPYALAYSGQTRHPAMIRVRPERTRHRFPIGNRVERFVRPITWSEGQSAFKLRRGRPLRKLARSAWRLGRWLADRMRARLRRPEAACTIRCVTEFDERIDALWQNASSQFDFVMTRDRAHLSYRYADRRAGSFTIMLAEEGKRALGYAVLSMDRRKRRGYVGDVLVLPDRAEAARALLKEAVAWGRANNLSALECWLPLHHPYHAALIDTGFVLRRRKQASLCRVMHDATHEELAFLQEPRAAIHITMGDTDLV